MKNSRRLFALLLTAVLLLNCVGMGFAAESDDDSGEFADVSMSAYYADAVAWATLNNITNGTGANSFSPGKTCTRGQIVTFLWRAKGSPHPVSARNSFTDVPADAYYADAVQWAVENNVTNGLTKTTFGPSRTCTRGQIVTFLWRAEGMPGTGGQNTFTDVDNNAYYASAVIWAVQHGITNGTSTSKFSPSQSCTRGQVVTFLFRSTVNGSTLPGQHNHSLKLSREAAPTCTENGSIAYWYCTACGKLFSHKDVNKEISASSVVIPATGHTPVIDPAVAPTKDSEGLTEGSHCSVCGAVLVAQQTIPALDENSFSITYIIDNNDYYLKTLQIHNDNPPYYSGKTGLELTDLMVDGYVFDGWYTGAGANATLVTSIPKGSTGNKTLYAHWTPREYTIQFDSPLVPMESKTYTVNRGATLVNPDWEGYTFIGWSDDWGNVLTSVPVGTVGDLTLHANWTSKRNQTRPVEKLGDPVIVEDFDEGLILFAYEIGTVENIPLYTIKDFGNTSGITVSETITVTDEVSSSSAETIANTISNATTASNSWTLSKDWNETTTVDETHLSETNTSYSAALDIGHSSSGNWNISGSVGETHGSTTTDGWKNGVSGKVTVYAEAEGKAKVPLVAEGSAKYGGSLEVGVEGEKTHSTTSSDSRTWNNSTSIGGSSSSSRNLSLSKSMMSKISDQTSYGHSYTEGGSNSQTQQLATSQSNTNEYSTALTYSTAKVQTTTKTYTNAGAKQGWYRLVCAGTAHVFAVVGYDIANRTYFTYTYSIMDEQTSDFMDYSVSTSQFNDYENGVLPFEVPYFVNDYVDSIVFATDGLVVDIDTGTIVAYNGKDDYVIIPQYMTVDNGDGTNTVVKITNIDPYVFRGNEDLFAVQLGRYITQIPDSAFEGCTSLNYVASETITKIGNNAFAGCTGLLDYTVPDSVESLGQNAFTDVPSLTVHASNEQVAQAAVTAGAKKLTLDVSAVASGLDGCTLDIPKSVKTFELNGGGQSFRGLTLISGAENTALNNISITASGTIPLQFNSDNVTLGRVTVSAPGIVMLLSQATTLSLFGTNNLVSAGTNAVLCKSVKLQWANPNAVGKMNVDGNVLICGNLTNEQYLTLNRGEIKHITEEEYEQMLKTFRLIFNANGGQCDVSAMEITFNTPVGSLPTPTKDYSDFDGWFLEDGTQVTSTTVFSTGSDQVVYAKWSDKSLSDWVPVSQVPESAEIVERKWSYHLVTTAESRDTGMSGFTQTGSYWVKSGSGSANYASFPSGFDTGNWIYTSFAKSAYTASSSETAKREVANKWAGYVYYHWMYDTSYSNGVLNRAIYDRYGWGPSNGYLYKFFGAFLSSTNYPYQSNDYCNNLNKANYYVSDRTNWDSCQGALRWFRFDYYTSTYTDYYKMFQYKKEEDKESSTAVSEGTVGNSVISNVQQWVRYRAK